MLTPIPHNIPSDPKSAYAAGYSAGWQARIDYLARSTEAKAAAAKANGRKGGRPRKSPPKGHQA